MKTIIILIALFASNTCLSQDIYKRNLVLMGSDFEITVVANSSLEGKEAIDIAIAEISRIEKLISSWNKHSQTSAINKNAGITPIVVDIELIDLIERSIGISKLTDGAFDISYASMDHIWKFDGSMSKIPEKTKVKASVSKVGFDNIIISRPMHTVYLKEKGMKIGFGAIGKGYAADKAKELLKQMGISAGIINASGDMNTWGVQPNGSTWKVAITNPMDKSKSFGIIDLENNAVVTSGNYEKYVSFKGKRYAHIIDPRTGYPASGIVSVTVFAPKAELADALATSVFVMGIETGINRIDQLASVECIIVDDQGQLHTSKNLKINL